MSPAPKITQDDIERLREMLRDARAEAEKAGPPHAMWEFIFDAEAWLEGKPTVLRGTREEVFAQLVSIYYS